MKDRDKSSRYGAEPKAPAVPEKPARPTVKCGTCSRACSEVGHLKGKEVTPKDAKGYKLYECVRCGLHLEQPACECCGVEVGTIIVSPDDTAQEAAKRMGAN